MTLDELKEVRARHTVSAAIRRAWDRRRTHVDEIEAAIAESEVRESVLREGVLRRVDDYGAHGSESLRGRVEVVCGQAWCAEQARRRPERAAAYRSRVEAYRRRTPPAPEPVVVVEVPSAPSSRPEPVERKAAVEFDEEACRRGLERMAKAREQLRQRAQIPAAEAPRPCPEPVYEWRIDIGVRATGEVYSKVVKGSAALVQVVAKREALEKGALVWRAVRGDRRAQVPIPQTVEEVEL